MSEGSHVDPEVSDFSDEEHRRLVEAACAWPGGATQEEMELVLDWAWGTRTAAALLRLVLEGKIAAKSVTNADGTTEMTFARRSDPGAPVEPAAKPNKATEGSPGPRYSLSQHRMTRCQSDDDGYCDFSECPQLRDDEPKRSGRHCPLDQSEEEGE